ncbi:putative NIF3 family GTP cyclohydrolase 1 type 2 [Hydrogenispora ethanolica]|uniref:GTP cyclohydrolase 1 type 2 homolog n=1 Tax=Hydrogenispora ethanolica TaxID=1082276 RepID=A0A4R1S714_HYDET|nr:Nif3-like dinuclear metal center hexameric protein [Hydrogenispora ethanolica]TCL75091.1 putative NIF3 family GTP cyclohydrolase 1 type 2 [Hydrogenispora ethanolica]
MEVETLVHILQELIPGKNAGGSLRFVPDLGTLPVGRIGVAVDPTPENIQTAVERGIDLLITYHPWTGEATEIVNHANLRLLALHGNWDSAPAGILPELVQACELREVAERDGVMIGTTETALRGLIEVCQRTLELTVVPYFGELRSPVRKVGIYLGSGFLPHRRAVWETCRAQGCDTLLSGELTMAALRFGTEHQLKLIDLGHSAAARAGMNKFRRLLAERLSDHCPVDFLDGLYSCNYFTSYSILDNYSAAFTESDDLEMGPELFSFIEKME